MKESVELVIEASLQVRRIGGACSLFILNELPRHYQQKLLPAQFHNTRQQLTNRDPLAELQMLVLPIMFR